MRFERITLSNRSFFKLIYLKFPLRIDLLNVVSLYIETLVFFRWKNYNLFLSDFFFWLLLALRSALKKIPWLFTKSLCHFLHVLLLMKAYSVRYTRPPLKIIGSIGLSAIHFRSNLIRKASFYTLLGRFRLPWPHPFCLN